MRQKVGNPGGVVEVALASECLATRPTARCCLVALPPSAQLNTHCTTYSISTLQRWQRCIYLLIEELASM
jgi:hypothetical protein